MLCRVVFNFVIFIYNGISFHNKKKPMGWLDKLHGPLVSHRKVWMIGIRGWNDIVSNALNFQELSLLEYY